MIYGSSHEKEQDEKVIDEATKNRASNGYKLLSEWKTPPGSQRDNSFKSESLEQWLESVKKECIESGHWKAAAIQVGEVLYYAPRSDDGLWIEPVCEILDSKETDAFRRGLQSEIYNSRGVHGYSGGKEEIKLAEKYEEIAELAEGKGFSRLGEAMRNLGKTYRYEAERSIERWSED